MLKERLGQDLLSILERISQVASRSEVTVFAVGGFVRDLLLNIPNKDIDIVVEGNGILFASDLAEEFDGKVKSHEKFGFIEPFKYYVPSIGISQMVYMPNNLNPDGAKYLLVTSLRAGSIYVIKINDEFNKIIDEDRLFFSQRRIRDIEYDEENNVFFLIFEFTPSIGVLELNN